ncbi:NADH-quinone oxidoreductase subunit N [Streptomyces sp. NBC_01762]|uniref:NADH-quinone oxidoreductase subunit N n=1 Tax=unclassified Streptomyces TaxID=2593676 RepID=UPI002DDB75C1|nr:MULTISPECIES: NADH-quinone oxidoreductase subunit N [unclassified Streptomyces]WSC46735.1 NADH-quinone oxidoreductase subunit N [Streptomyces sp. NBC_01762]WSD26387.1 NADH-quinone oxidoreductase subunit N [Streptomyces sp. NBC_01751]
MTTAADSTTSLVQSVDWLAIAPPVVVATVALIILVADLFLPEERKPLLGLASIAALVAGLALLIPLRGGNHSTFCLTTGTGTEACSYTADHFALIIQVLVLGGALLTALLSFGDTRRLPAGEFWFLLLSSAAGAALLPAARDLATLVVALEVASLPAFALVGIKRDDRRSSEAALKFFLSSVVATAVMLLGVSFVYATTGTLHLTELATRLHDVPDQLSTLAKAGVALTLVGFAFKTAAAPFHFWVPDTYVGAPLPVAAYLSVVGKAVGFSGLILVTVIAFPSYADVWGPALAVVAALTMTVGNVAALRQTATRARSAVRLLAWSSIAQAGYLLVPIASAAYSGDEQIGSTVAYALMYAVVNLGAFAVAALVARTKPDNRLSDYRGLYATRPLTALAMGFFLLCLAGLPPGIVGLFAKVTVFSAAVDAGLGWLAVVMAVNVVIALYYYLQWTAALFRAPEEAEPAAPAPAAALADGPAVAVQTLRAPAAAPVSLTTAIALTAAVGIVLSGAPQLVLRFAAVNLF